MGDSDPRGEARSADEGGSPAAVAPPRTKDHAGASRQDIRELDGLLQALSRRCAEEEPALAARERALRERDEALQRAMAAHAAALPGLQAERQASEARASREQKGAAAAAAREARAIEAEVGLGARREALRQVLRRDGPSRDLLWEALAILEGGGGGEGRPGQGAGIAAGVDSDDSEADGAGGVGVVRPASPRPVFASRHRESLERSVARYVALYHVARELRARVARDVLAAAEASVRTARAEAVARARALEEEEEEEAPQGHRAGGAETGGEGEGSPAGRDVGRQRLGGRSARDGKLEPRAGSGDGGARGGRHSRGRDEGTAESGGARLRGAAAERPAPPAPFAPFESAVRCALASLWARLCEASTLGRDPTRDDPPLAAHAAADLVLAAGRVLARWEGRRA